MSTRWDEDEYNETNNRTSAKIIDSSGKLQTLLEEINRKEEKPTEEGKGSTDSQQEENDEDKLLEDTFSFVMVAHHPEIVMKLLSCLIGMPYVLFRNCLSKLGCKRNSEDEDDGRSSQGVERGQLANGGQSETVSLRIEENGVPESVKNDQSNHDGAKNCCQRIVDNWFFHFLPFWFSMAVFGTQIFIYTIVFLNFLSSEEGVPPNAPPLLRSGQILAGIISLFTQSDVLDAIIMSSHGAEQLSEFLARPYYNKAYISLAMRFFAGFVGIATTFVLIISSTEIVELLLNFSAMEFVAGLDGIAYEVASQGFLGTTLAEATSLVSDFKYTSKTSKNPEMEEHKKTRKNYFFFLYVVVVLGCFSVVWYFQTTRRTVRNEVYVQFDDSDIPELFGVSGVYEGCYFGRDSSEAGPIRYVPYGIACEFNDDTGAFVFCKEFKAWVYNYQKFYDPCNQDNFNLWSSKGDDGKDSDAFDLATHADAQWFVQINEQGREIALDDESILIENRVDKFHDPFGDRCEALSFGTGDEIMFEKLDSNRDLQCPEIVNYNYIYDEMYIDLGLMHRSIFKRGKIGGGPEEFEVIVYNGLRWLLVDLNISEFMMKLPENYGKELLPACQSDSNFGCSWCIFALVFRNDWNWLLNGKIANIKAMSGPMGLFSLEDTGVPASDLKWHEPQRYLDRYVRPGGELPLVRAAGGGGSGGSLNVTSNETDLMSITTSGEEFFFQCRENRIKPNCPSEYKGISVLFGTDMFPWENQVLVYQNQNDFNTVLSQTGLYTIVLDANQPATGPFLLNGEDVSIIHFENQNAKYDISFCAPENGCTQVVFTDTNFDGLDPPGNYELYYGDEKSASFFPNPNPETKKVPEWTCKWHQIGTQCNNANVDDFEEAFFCSDLIDYVYSVYLDDDDN